MMLPDMFPFLILSIGFAVVAGVIVTEALGDRVVSRTDIDGRQATDEETRKSAGGPGVAPYPASAGEASDEPQGADLDGSSGAGDTAGAGSAVEGEGFLSWLGSALAGGCGGGGSGGGGGCCGGGC